MKPLPTLVSANWTITSFYDAVVNVLQTDRSSSELRLFFYGITDSGWREIRGHVRRWLRADSERMVVAYVGTDHALTDGTALERMQADGVHVRILIRYDGIYHPKLVWLTHERCSTLVAGSNNLTLDGLCHNIEFATLVSLKMRPRVLQRWFREVHDASDLLTTDMLDSYVSEHKEFEERRAKARAVGRFTWSRRTRQRARRGRTDKRRRRQLVKAGVGDLILEIMERETGAGGSQIQIPISVANTFFGLSNRASASAAIVLRNVETRDTRHLTMTLFANRTARLVLHELRYRDRPCLVLFRRRNSGRSRFDFEIIRRAIQPVRHESLLSRCTQQTRTGSRRWEIVS